MIQAFDDLLEIVYILGDRFEGVIVFLCSCQGEQLAVLPQAAVEALDHSDYVFERLTLLAEILRALAVGPDVGIFEQCRDFVQPPAFVIEVKDTSVDLRHAGRDRLAG